MDDVLTDPNCFECGGPLTIVERDTSFIKVVCAHCGNSHELEVEIASDGSHVYWPAFRICLKGDVSA